jgi:hypothetical protein
VALGDTRGEADAAVDSVPVAQPEPVVLGVGDVLAAVVCDADALSEPLALAQPLEETERLPV